LREVFKKLTQRRKGAKKEKLESPFRGNGGEWIISATLEIGFNPA